jgi:hypothetical protein
MIYSSENKKKKKGRRIETIAMENVARAHTMQLPSGYVLETTTLIDAIIMTSKKKKRKKKKNREKKLRTFPLSLLCRCYSLRTSDRICVLLFAHTHKHT